MIRVVVTKIHKVDSSIFFMTGALHHKTITRGGDESPPPPHLPSSMAGEIFLWDSNGELVGVDDETQHGLLWPNDQL
jgi:hypothetical protein